MAPVHEADWYDYPQYFDLAFRDETRLEADFFEAAFARYASEPVRRIYEPGCGGGRLVIEMARRGYQVCAIDTNRRAVQYVRQRLKRRRLSGDVQCGDMVDFRWPRKVDAAFNTFNTFRHLLSEEAACEHLVTMSHNVRRGGIYILGFHLLPLDVDLQSCERWTARHAATRLHVTLQVVAASRRQRVERLQVSMLVRSPGRQLRLRHEFAFRMYTATQFQKLLNRVPQWQLLDVFDFWYEIDHPLALDDRITDAVFVLRRTTPS